MFVVCCSRVWMFIVSLWCVVCWSSLFVVGGLLHVRVRCLLLTFSLCDCALLVVVVCCVLCVVTMRRWLLFDVVVGCVLLVVCSCYLSLLPVVVCYVGLCVVVGDWRY